jgi:hypothetical protein
MTRTSKCEWAMSDLPATGKCHPQYNRATHHIHLNHEVYHYAYVCIVHPPQKPSTLTLCDEKPQGFLAPLVSELTMCSSRDHFL